MWVYWHNRGIDVFVLFSSRFYLVAGDLCTSTREVSADIPSLLLSSTASAAVSLEFYGITRKHNVTGRNSERALLVG